MDEPSHPRSVSALRTRLVALREDRRRRQHQRRSSSPFRRRSLLPSERARVLEKTAGRCHICGGEVVVKWQADHVLAHAGGGPHAIDNFLAAHALCNNYRWDYDPEEFQWILKIGVWARRQMESTSSFGEALRTRFFDYEEHRHARRRVVHRAKKEEQV